MRSSRKLGTDTVVVVLMVMAIMTYPTVKKVVELVERQ